MNPMNQFLGISGYEYDLGAKLIDFWNEQSTWSQETFGSDSVRGPQGPIKHIIKECDEVLENPKDLKEYVDIGVLLCDATRRAGFTLEQLVNGMYEKLQENKRREWPKMSQVTYEQPYKKKTLTSFVWCCTAWLNGEQIKTVEASSPEKALEICKAEVNRLPVEHIRE